MRRNVLAMLLAAASLAPAETLVLKNFTLIDGTGKAPLAGAAMVITDGKIQAVGAAASVKTPAGAQTVDLAGKFVMPGIINLHGHLGNVIDLTQDAKFFTKENVEAQLKTYSKYGVTSMLSMGSDKPLIYDMRTAQRVARPNMTRIFTAGRGFTGVGGYPTTVPGNKGIPYEVSTVEDVRKDIAELAPQKPDFVKIWVDDHLGKEVKIAGELSKAIISEAKKYGLKTCAHIFYYSDAKELTDAGLYACAHSVRDREVDSALIASMKKNGTWQLGTLARELSTFVYAKRPDFFDDPFFKQGLSAKALAGVDSDAFRQKQNADHDLPKYPGFLAMAQKNLKKLYDAGIKVGFATDSGPPARFSGFAEHKEMELMAQAGFTPLQIISIFSKSSAEFLGRSKDLGTLENGHWADLVVLTKNPVDDIKNSKTIDAVYIAGNKVR